MAFWNRRQAEPGPLPQPVPEESLQAEVDKIRWWHPIDLGNGLVTPGADVHIRARLAEIQMPGDLSGKAVLDIGAWDGFFSFEAERRGASRVLATDSFCWDGGGWGSKAGLELARRALKSRVEDKWIVVEDLSPQTVGVFDVVFFLGVLYHMRHPLLVLERVASVTSGLLIMQTQVDMVGIDRPAMAFYPGTELNGDPTNWVGLNPAAVVAMLKDVGFSRVDILHKSFGDDVLFDPKAPITPKHITVHAWK